MGQQTDLFLIILAAGKGTRMRSEQAKVLHQIFYAPMLHHVMEAVKPLKSDITAVVLGHQKEMVAESLVAYDAVSCVQREQLGTGHAVLCAEPLLAGKKGTVMILCGDTPLIQTETLEQMLVAHKKHGGPLTMMSTLLDFPANYGRVIVNDAGLVLSIVEEKDATSEQKAIKEINAGIYCVDSDFLFSALKQVGRNNSQGEVYLTDIVAIATKQNIPVEKYTISCSSEVLGVNSRVELAEAHHELQRRRNRQLMLDGVTMYDPASISVAPEVEIGQDVILFPGVHITGHSSIGQKAVLENGVLVKNCRIGENAWIGAYSYLEQCSVPAGKVIAPHSVIREETR